MNVTGAVIVVNVQVRALCECKRATVWEATKAQCYWGFCAARYVEFV
jgi:hypothetical protein